LTTREKLLFCAGILGSALLAQAVAELLRNLPAPGWGPPTPAASQSAETDVERLLRQALPEGVQL
jgi:hypothetical protein